MSREFGSSRTEHPGTSIRASSTALLTIDTADRMRFDANGYRIDTTAPNDIYINKQQSIVKGYFTRLALTELNMQWNTPNVIESGACKNNTLLLERSLTVDGPVVASYTVELAEGFYTPNELAEAIQTTLNDGAGVFGVTSWECSYGSRGGAFSLGDTSDTVRFRIHPQNLGQKDDLCNLMGFSTPSQLFNYGVLGSYAPMVYTPYFDIQSDQLTKKQNVLDGASSTITGTQLLTRVYLNEYGVNRRYDAEPITPEGTGCVIVGVRPFSLYREFQNPKQIFWDTKEYIDVIDLRLVDYKGRLLYMPPQGSAVLGTGSDARLTICGNSTNYQMTIQVTET